MAILFALISLVGWAVGDIFGTLNSRKIGGVNNAFWGHLLAAVFAGFYIPFAGPVTDWGMFFLALGLGCLNVTATLLYFRSLETEMASLVGAIAGSFSIVTVTLSVIIFGEKLNFFQATGIILALSGVFLASANFKELKALNFSKIISGKPVKFALISMLLWGIYFTFITIPARKIGWFWSSYPLNLAVLYFVPLGLVKINSIKLINNSRTIAYWLGFVILITAGNFAFNIGVLSGYNSVVAPIAGSYPVLFVFLAKFVFKEKLSGQKLLGIIFSLFGIVLISVFS